MARCRFVQPEPVRLPLSDGDWIDVKKELNAGEQRRIFTSLVRTMQMDGKAELNPDQVGKTKILAYVVDWSFVDEKGARTKFSEAALDAVDPASYKEINDAVDKHDEAAEAAREERKNARAGQTGSIATSLSAVS